MQQHESKLLELSGTVDRIIFKNEQNGYSVLEIAIDQEYVVAVGNLSSINVGENVRLLGNFKKHQTFGDQFSVKAYERMLPTTKENILRYLSSGVIKGMGPSTAEKLLEHFGAEILNILESTPEKILFTPGLSKIKAKKIIEEYNKVFGMRELMEYLAKFGVIPEKATTLWQSLENKAIIKIKQDPYFLCEEPFFVDFEIAEKISISLNGNLEDECRIRAGILYILQHNIENGHTCLPKEKLLQACVNFLEIPFDQVEQILEKMRKESQLAEEFFNERKFIFTNKMHKAEIYIAGRLNMIMNFPAQKISLQEKDIELTEQRNCITYAQLQKQAIKNAMEKGMLVLTGGPGTGKTTTLNAIIRLLEEKGERVFLAAPTGRAAQRMCEMTGKQAKTIHRLLEVEFDKQERQTFNKNEKNLLECDALVLDEVSMIDVVLFESVLKALPMGCRLILVGDSDQLPSVGAGNVLADIIHSKKVPTIHLTEIFRQSMQSLIVTNAHKIVKGEMPDLDCKNKDFFFLNSQEIYKAAHIVKELCQSRLPKTYNFSPLDDIQVIAPSKKGELGTINLNKILQEALNPQENNKEEINVFGKIFRVGDKVMQIKNNYSIPFAKTDGSMGEGIFNGDIGILQSIDIANSILVVQFDEKFAKYDLESAIDLDLAYAITVHKSQGSEFKAVVMPIFSGPAQLFYRNLLYTSVTRAKKLLIIVGKKDTVLQMVENDKKNRRYSGLKFFM